MIAGDHDSPVQPEFNNWELIPQDTDILVTHGPPFGILDQLNSDTPHLGCSELAKIVTRLKPKLHVFGHIHGGYGRSTSTDGSISINASVVDEEYRLAHKAHFVEIE